MRTYLRWNLFALSPSSQSKPHDRRSGPSHTPSPSDAHPLCMAWAESGATYSPSSYPEAGAALRSCRQPQHWARTSPQTTHVGSSGCTCVPSLAQEDRRFNAALSAGMPLCTGGHCLTSFCWDSHSGASGNRQFGSTDWFLSHYCPYRCPSSPRNSACN